VIDGKRFPLLKNERDEIVSIANVLPIELIVSICGKLENLMSLFLCKNPIF
jgi:hypothetical protein